MRGIVWILMFFLLSAVPAADAAPYRLKAGDVLDIAVWQDSKLNRQIVIAPDGMVAFPLAGRFKASGQTTGAIEETLRARLKKQYTDDLDITVTIARLADPPPEKAEEPEKEPEWTIYVTGEVARPGQFVVKTTPPTVLQAIALSGGLGPFAAERKIKIHRKKNGAESVYSFNYAEYEKGHDPGNNMVLRSGDVVVVPERGLFE